MYLMAKSAHKQTIDLVSRAVMDDTATIRREMDPVLASILGLRRLYTCSDGPLNGAIDNIVLMIDLKRSCRWVMRNLLHVNVCTIFASSLICLPKNRVQRLFKALVINDRADVFRYHHLQTFNRLIR